MSSGSRYRNAASLCVESNAVAWRFSLQDQQTANECMITAIKGNLSQHHIESYISPGSNVSSGSGSNNAASLPVESNAVACRFSRQNQQTANKCMITAIKGNHSQHHNESYTHRSNVSSGSGSNNAASLPVEYNAVAWRFSLRDQKTANECMITAIKGNHS
jgi:hypothetical protein